MYACMQSPPVRAASLQAVRSLYPLFAHPQFLVFGLYIVPCCAASIPMHQEPGRVGACCGRFGYVVQSFLCCELAECSTGRNESG
jgi:hypothetical protein